MKGTLVPFEVTEKNKKHERSHFMLGFNVVVFNGVDGVT
jgi:hypothetical protein